MPPDTDAAPRDGIFYVTDPGFALPTIAGALELRRKVAASRADIRIVLTGMDAGTVSRLRDALAPSGLIVDTLPAQLFSGFDQAKFNKTHVPMATLGRFFMLDAAPDIYRRIVYLDGDTWPAGDITELLDAPLPDGHLAAAEDQSFFYQNDTGKTGAAVRGYFAGLGIDGTNGYFNAGVLMAGSETWRALSREAFDFFRRQPALCRYHDQSALNAVAGNRRTRLAPRWNFLAMYTQWGLRRTGDPAIRHFCGGAKPWCFAEDPFHPVFAERFAALADLGLAAPACPEQKTAAERAALRRNRLKLATVLRHRRRHRQQLYDWLVQHAGIP